MSFKRSCLENKWNVGDRVIAGSVIGNGEPGTVTRIERELVRVKWDTPTHLTASQQHDWLSPEPVEDPDSPV